MSRLTAQSPGALLKRGTGVWPGSWDWGLPSTSQFSFPGFPPPPHSAHPSGLGLRRAETEPPLWTSSLCQKELACSQDSKHLPTAKQQRACQLVLLPSLTRDLDSQGHTGRFPGFMDLHSP